MTMSGEQLSTTSSTTKTHYCYRCAHPKNLHEFGAGHCGDKVRLNVAVKMISSLKSAVIDSWAYNFIGEPNISKEDYFFRSYLLMCKCEFFWANKDFAYDDIATEKGMT